MTKYERGKLLSAQNRKSQVLTTNIPHVYLRYIYIYIYIYMLLLTHVVKSISMRKEMFLAPAHWSSSNT